MRNRSFILQSSLVCPDSEKALLKKNLKDRLDDILHYKLVMITAGLGFGKTTTAGLIFHHCGADGCWYRVSENTLDLATFAQHMTEGIRRCIPDFFDDGDLQQYLEWGVTSAASRVVSEIQEKIGTSYYIVIDDWHLVDRNRQVNEFVSFLLEHTGRHIHFILTSQTETDLPLAKMISTNAAVVIDEGHLRFTPDEAHHFFKGMGSDRDLESYARQACQKTDGWAAGIKLLAFCLDSDNESGQFHTAIRKADHYFYDYMESEVFDRLSDDEKLFLVRTCILPIMTADICDQVLGIESSHIFLEHFERQRLFTRKIGEQGYLYHSVFKSFLVQRMERDCTRIERDELYDHAAAFFMETDEWKSALSLFEKAGNEKAIHRLLIRYGQQLVYDGEQDAFLKYSRLMSSGIAENCPVIQSCLACISLFNGNAADAESRYEKALALFEKKKDPNGRIKILTAITAFSFQAGNMKQIESQVSYLLDHGIDDPYARIELILKLIYCSSYMGKFNAAQKLIQQVEKLMADQKTSDRQVFFNDVLTFHQLMWYQHQGDFLAAQNLGKKQYKSVRLRLTAFQQNAWTAYHLGQFEQGVAIAESGIDFMSKNRIADAFIMAWSQVAVAVNLVGQDEMDRAFQILEKCGRFFNDQQFNWGAGFVCWIRAMCHLKKDEIDNAKDETQRALDLISGLGLRLLKAFLHLLKIKLYLLQGKIEQAGLLLERFEQQDRIKYLLDSHMVKVHYLSTRFCFNFITGRHQEGLVHLEKFIAICEDREYDIGEIVCCQLVQRIKKKGSYNIRKSAPVVKLDDYFQERFFVRHSLQVSFFSKFSVKTQITAIADQSWNNKKARRLFQYLVLFLNKGFTPKDVLMELLWPGEDPDKSSKRFHVTLAALRKILQPEITRGQPSAYIISSKDTYLLEPGKNSIIDVEQFDEIFLRSDAVTEPQKQIEKYQQLLLIYRDDFLPEQLYDEWTQNPRQYYHDRYLEILTRMIRIYKETGQFQACIDLLKKYLEKDRDEEAIYSNLMECYARLGRTKKVAEILKMCQAHMENELGCPVRPETLALYDKLLKL